jgi:hypothetical protein
VLAEGTRRLEQYFKEMEIRPALLDLVDYLDGGGRIVSYPVGFDADEGRAYFLVVILDTLPGGLCSNSRSASSSATSILALSTAIGNPATWHN